MEVGCGGGGGVESGAVRGWGASGGSWVCVLNTVQPRKKLQYIAISLHFLFLCVYVVGGGVEGGAGCQKRGVGGHGSMSKYTSIQF